MTYDVIVVGGGSAGLLAAREVAGAGYRVAVIEEHQEIGYPVKCSGLFSISGLKALNLKLDSSVILNTIKGGRFYSPAGREFLAYSNVERAHVVERKMFDKLLAREAARAGADIRLKTKATGIEIKDKVSVGISSAEGNSKISSQLIIAADGARSNVARKLGIMTPKKFVAAAQVEVESAEVEHDIAEIYFGREYAPNFYAWILPKGEVYEVGVGTRDPRITPREYLQKFVEQHPVAAKKIRGKSVLEYNTGGIPIELAEQTAAERTLIVGDAAGQVKASTGGGVVVGGIAARIAGRACVRALEDKNFSKDFLTKEYEEKWRREIGFELEVHAALRKMFDSLSDEQLEKLFQLAVEENIQELMVKYSDTDRPSQFVQELAKNPRIVDSLQRFLDFKILK